MAFGSDAATTALCAPEGYDAKVLTESVESDDKTTTGGGDDAVTHTPLVVSGHGHIAKRPAWGGAFRYVTWWLEWSGSQICTLAHVGSNPTHVSGAVPLTVAAGPPRLF